MSTKPIVIFNHGCTQASLKKAEDTLTELGHTFIVCQLEHGNVLPAVEDVHGCVLMGGPMSVYEEEKYPWLKNEKIWVKSFIKTGKPVFGICLGCQILAELYGGQVYRGEKGISIGFREAHLHVTDDPIFGNELKNAHVYAWHQDTFKPAQGQRLMQGVMYNEQAVKFADNVYGVQFHPEVTLETMKKWYARDSQCPEMSKKLPCIHQETQKAAEHLPPVHLWLQNFMGRLFGAETV